MTSQAAPIHLQTSAPPGFYWGQRAFRPGLPLQLFFVALWLLLGWSLALASEPSPDFQAQRAALEVQRGAETRRFSAQESQCYQRFAVNACLQDVQRERTQALNRIRQQELGLNALERERNAAQEKAALEDRARERAQREREVSQRNGAADLAAKEQALRDKQADHASRGSAAPNSTDKQSQESAARGVLDPQVQAQNRAAFVKKQEEALRRKAELEKRLKEKTGSSQALPLPAP